MKYVKCPFGHVICYDCYLLLPIKNKCCVCTNYYSYPMLYCNPTERFNRIEHATDEYGQITKIE